MIDSPRDLAIFINIYGSGLRVSEICNLKIQDVDSKGMRLFLRQAKGKKDRYTILSKRGLEALRRYWKIYKPANPQNWLFPGTTKHGNLGTNGVELAFRKYKKKAGITTPGTVHTLRHCFASHALENGVEPMYIKTLLGHVTYSATNVYLHVSKIKMYQIDSPKTTCQVLFTGKRISFLTMYISSAKWTNVFTIKRKTAKYYSTVLFVQWDTIWFFSFGFLHLKQDHLHYFAEGKNSASHRQ